MSTGPIPFIKIFNDVAIAVNQSGKRKGAFAPYMEIWHADIEDFIDLKMKTGDERLRTHDLFPAIWACDLFFKRVKEEGNWSLFCPSEVSQLHELYGKDFEKAYVEAESKGLARKVIPALELWQKWLDRLHRTGAPWVTFKDECNRRNPQAHKGVVHNSNLCVAPETKILTDKGHLPICELEGQKVNVWNGEEWSEVEVIKTGENQKLITVILDNMAVIECTPYHKFYVQEGYWRGNVVEKRAHELQPGDKLIKFELPVIEGEKEFPLAYTAGFFTGDGTYGHGKPILHLYGEKKELVPHLALRSGSGIEQANGRLSYLVDHAVPAKFTVPTAEHTIESRLRWLAGFLDADGCVTRNGENQSLQAASVNLEFLHDVRLMLQTLGVSSRVNFLRDEGVVRFADDQPAYATKPIYRLLIASNEAQRLLELGLDCKRLSLAKHSPNRNAARFVSVLDIVDDGRVDDTYCFTEPKRHMGVFNGILTGNCTEITLNNSDTETFVCNLGSLNLANIDSEDELRYVTRIAMRMLDNVIDINYYPTENSRRSNLQHRPVGLGVMGYAEWLCKQGIDWESEAHLKAADELFERISYYAIDASAELAKERGAYPSFAGSTWSKGQLTIDHARDKSCHVFGKTEWQVLREKVKQTGIRNSNLLAIAPTATIANICGTTECIQPINEHVLVKENLSGSFKIISPLLKYGRKDLAKTVWEIDQAWLIRAAAVRQKWICQSQSLNLFKRAGIRGRELSDWYLLANELGVKTTYYLKVQKEMGKTERVGEGFEKTVTAPVNSADDFVCEACQ